MFSPCQARTHFVGRHGGYPTSHEQHHEAAPSRSAQTYMHQSIKFILYIIFSQGRLMLKRRHQPELFGEVVRLRGNR